MANLYLLKTKPQYDIQKKSVSKWRKVSIMLAIVVIIETTILYSAWTR